MDTKNKNLGEKNTVDVKIKNDDSEDLDKAKNKTKDQKSKLTSGEESSSEKSDELSEASSGANFVEALTTQFELHVQLTDKILDEVNLDGIAKYIKENHCKNIITMVGAGISTAAGIPDFRSPGTGIYHNLKKYNLPYMQAIFELNYFMKKPEPFYQLASELLPGEYLPTKAHYFIKLLEEKGILLRHYTQNIDNLDRMAGISDEKLIEAHGTFYKSHCVACHHEYDFDWLKDKMFKKQIPHCTECDGIVKPDIIFFGENLPRKFYQHIPTDFNECDLLIIMGSSLEVEPFASLALRPKKSCPRLMINATKVGNNINFLLGGNTNQRDVLWIGDCDTGCQELAQKLGWEEDLVKLISKGREGLKK